MFTLRFHSGFVNSLPGPTPPACGSSGPVLPAGGILRLIALLGALAVGLQQPLSAQAPGTMQVTARVVPASVAWAGIAEGTEAARSAARERSGRHLVRRSRLFLTRAEIRSSGVRPLLIVTIHQPHN